MIERLLIANRGEIARRIIRTSRRLGMTTVAVYSGVDRGAAFVREADEAVPLDGDTPAQSYLRGDAVIEAARLAEADAVHPGYGFLSENAEFARQVISAGLVWVGPPPDAIDAMGSKLAARELMSGIGVPVLPGRDLTGVGSDDLLSVAEEVGWPVLVKASFGGGGRGMRVVRQPGQLAEAVASAAREATAAFGDGTVFLEHYVDRPRHIEIQILGDQHGSLIHLFERECSIQRRHQKLIEEAPSVAVDPTLRAAMGDAAVRAGRAIGYTGAGTVEFILAPDGRFFFLEVNTRLQVEHPVTEEVTGVDLVALQLAVAEGRPVPDELHGRVMAGHAVEVRLCAEDPLHEYLPTTGTLGCVEFPEAPGIRIEAGIQSGDEVSVHYDSMLAKIIAHGPTRADAIRMLTAALRRTRVLGVTTNIELLVAILGHQDFREGKFDTHFLDRCTPDTLITASTEGEVGLGALAAALADQHIERQQATAWVQAPSGWRNNPSDLQRRRYRIGARTLEVGYRMGRDPTFEVDGQRLPVTLAAVNVNHVALIAGGVQRRFRIDRSGSSVWVESVRGRIQLETESRFGEADAVASAGSLLAPMPGIVVRVEVKEGDLVVAGQVLLALEAMKMEHPVLAPTDGTITELSVRVGTNVQSGAVLALITAGGTEAA